VLSGDQDVTPETRQTPLEDTASEKTDRVEEPDEDTNEKPQAEALAPSQAALQEESAAARSSLTWLEICARSELNEIKARQELGVKSVISRVQVTPTASAAHDEGDGEEDDAEVKGGKGLFGSGFGNLTVFLASFFGALLLISALIVFWPAGGPEHVQIRPPTVSANRAVNMKALAAWQRPRIAAERTASDPHAYLPPPLTAYGFTLPRRKPSPEAPAPVENNGENHSTIPGEPRAETGLNDTVPRAETRASLREPAAVALATQTEAAGQRMAADVMSQEAEETVNPEGATSATVSLHPEVLSVLPPAFAEATAPNAAKILNASNGPALAAPAVADSITEEAVVATIDPATEEPQDTFAPVAQESNQVDTALKLEDDPAKNGKTQDLAASASAETDPAPQPAEEMEDVAKALTETASEPAVPAGQNAIETVADFDSETTTLGPDELVTPAPPRAKPVAPEPSVERQVQLLLAEAAASEENRRLTQPAEDSAVDLYRQVLALDPQNGTAKESINRIHGLFMTWADYAEQEGNLDRAARHLRKALWIAPDNEVTEARLAAVQERLKADAVLAGFEPDTATQEDEGASAAAEPTEQAEQDVTTSDQGQTSEDQADKEEQQIEQAAPPKPQPKYLRARNFDIDSDQVVALVETGNVAAVSLLLEAGGPVNEPDSFGTAPLFYAISYGNPNMVALFLEWGAEVVARNPSQETPLMVASRLGRANIAKQLLAADADPNERSEAGWTAVFLSAARGHVEITQALIDAGAQVDYADPQGRTALTESASNGEVGTLAALISAGADVNARDAKGMTPLMLAAERGHAQSVRILLAADADSAIKSRDGRTAATLASDKGYGEIATIIMPHL
jgi:ankyrin repeat protein